MRIFVAGATGVLGRNLIPLLIADGHVLAGSTRSPDKAKQIEKLGVEPVVCDVFDPDRLISKVNAFKPEVIWHLLTDLPDDVALIGQFAAANNRVRTEGTKNLIEASRTAGCSRFIAQSVAWHLPGDGGKAIEYLESAVSAEGGVIIRYGQLYGPGTYYEDTLPGHPRISIGEASKCSLIALTMQPGTLSLCET